MTAKWNGRMTQTTDESCGPDTHDLPADLATLAAQLKHDAAELSRVYPPAGLVKSERGARRGLHSFWLKLGTTAAAVALIGMAAAAIAWWPSKRLDQPVTSTPTATSPTAAARGAAAMSNADAAPSEVALTEDSVEVVLQVSSPELEAILDLMGNETGDVQRVRF